MPDLRDNFRGALLGTFVGDALGMPLEGLDYIEIKKEYEAITHMIGGRLQKGSYTDDTQMMIGVAESLAKCNGFHGEDMANRFVENFSALRGYGKGTVKIIAAIKNGMKWSEAGKLVFNNGSFGNGAAMRAAPIGLYYHNDLDQLIEVAKKAARITHSHPLGYQGAILISLGVALVLRYDNLNNRANKKNLLQELKAAYPFSEEYVIPLDKIILLLEKERLPLNEAVHCLGNTVKAHESVPISFYSFLSNINSFEDALIYAVNLGGDTDTIGAMTGSLAGAYHGYGSLPERWLYELENGVKGKDYVRRLADILYENEKRLEV